VVDADDLRVLAALLMHIREPPMSQRFASSLMVPCPCRAALTTGMSPRFDVRKSRAAAAPPPGTEVHASPRICALLLA